jgi:transcription elongation factor Elf1
MHDPKMIECPECHGEKVLETMTGLTYDGAQTWKIVRCPKCDAEGEIEAPESDDAAELE